MKNMPKMETIETTYDSAYQMLSNKYGDSQAYSYLDSYRKTGKIEVIPNEEGVRDMLNNYAWYQFKLYMDKLEMTNYSGIENSFNKCMQSLTKEYGLSDAINKMQDFIDSGNINALVTSDGAHNGMIYSVDDYRNYLMYNNEYSTNIFDIYKNVW